MSLTYNIALQKAVENGVYVIGACGFDSIPADLGQICVRREMEGDVNSVETYLQVIVPDLPGATINFATFQVGNFNDMLYLFGSMERYRRVPSMDLPTPRN